MNVELELLRRLADAMDEYYLGNGDACLDNIMKEIYLHIYAIDQQSATNDVEMSNNFLDQDEEDEFISAWVVGTAKVPPILAKDAPGQWRDAIIKKS